MRSTTSAVGRTLRISSLNYFFFVAPELLTEVGYTLIPSAMAGHIHRRCPVNLSWILRSAGSTESGRSDGENYRRLTLCQALRRAVGCPADSGQVLAIGNLHFLPVRKRETHATLACRVQTRRLYPIRCRSDGFSPELTRIASSLYTSRWRLMWNLTPALEVWPSCSGTEYLPTWFVSYVVPLVGNYAFSYGAS